MRRLAALGLFLATSCTPAAIIHPVAHSSDGGWRSPRTAAATAVRSCAATKGRQVVPVNVYSAVSHVHIADLSGTSYGPPSPDPIRGTSFLVGAANHGRDPVLIHLSPEGALQTIRVPFHPEAAVVSGDHIRILKPWTTEGPAAWAAIDVSSPDAPKVGPVVPIPDLRPKEWPLAFAAGGKFALIVTRPVDPPGAPLTAVRFDVQTGRRVDAYELGKEARIADAWCGDEGCAIVASAGEGSLISVSFLANGGLVERLLVARGASSPAVVPTAAGALVVWQATGGRGLLGLPMDGLGEVMAAKPLAMGIEPEVDGMVVVRSDDGDALALRTSTRAPASWLFAKVAKDGRSLEKARELPLGGELFLSAANGAGGTLFVGTTADTSYDESGGYGFHSWSATVSALFEARSTAGVPVKLLSSAGEGRGGFYGLPLVRGGWAGVILIPTEEAYPPDTVMAPLREPCRGE